MLRTIFATALVALVGGALWFVARDWTGGPTGRPQVRENIADGQGLPEVDLPEAGGVSGSMTNDDATVGTAELARAPAPDQISPVPPALPSGQASAPEHDLPLGMPTPPTTVMVPARELQGVFNELLATLRSVNDARSAGAAAVVIGDLTVRIQGYTVEGAALPPEGRQAIIEVAKQTLPELRAEAVELRGSAYAEPVLAELDPLISDLELLSTGPG